MLNILTNPFVTMGTFAVLCVLCSVAWALKGQWPQALYWFAAVILNLSLIWRELAS